MGLDAYVFCDCLEKRKLEGPLPKNVTVNVEPSGYPVAVRDGEEIWEDHADWDQFACVHPHRALLHHRLGNIGLVALLRSELEREGAKFPILLGKVVYNGIHASDYLSLDSVRFLQLELARMKSFKCAGNVPTSKARWLAWKLLLTQYRYTSAAEADRFMHDFRIQMNELCDAALRIGKPIAFGC